MNHTRKVFSLGYEGKSLDEYVRLLKAHGIGLVADVRETPWSFKKGFSRTPLSERLAAEGIQYVHVKSAGNPSRHRKQGLPQTEVIELYKRHLDANPDCLDEISALIEGCDEGEVCLLCFENKPHDCHRKVILDRLVSKGELTSHHIW
jgi:uncharacterized protein (DUF488 family)